MKLERYIEKWHKHLLAELIVARGIKESVLGEVPSYGVIALVEETPVCSGFLRNIENNMGMIDGLITNPKRSSAERHEALNLVVGNLIEAAKEFKMNILMAFTLDDSVKGRANAFNFEELPHTMIKLDISGEK